MLITLIFFLPYGDMSSKDSMLKSRKQHVSNVSPVSYAQTLHHGADNLRA